MIMADIPVVRTVVGGTRDGLRNDGTRPKTSKMAVAEKAVGRHLNTVLPNPLIGVWSAAIWSLT